MRAATATYSQRVKTSDASGELREQADDDIERAGIDLFLRAALVTLKRPDEQQVVEQRLDENPKVEDDFEVAKLQEAFAALRHLVQLPF